MINGLQAGEAHNRFRGESYLQKLESFINLMDTDVRSFTFQNLDLNYLIDSHKTSARIVDKILPNTFQFFWEDFGVELKFTVPVKGQISLRTT